MHLNPCGSHCVQKAPFDLYKPIKEVLAVGFITFSITSSNSSGTFAISSLSFTILYLQGMPSNLTDRSFKFSPSKTKGAF